MEQPSNKPSTEAGFKASGKPDLFTAGSTILARAKIVSQRAAEYVRERTGETKSSTFDDDATDEHVPLPE